MPVIPEFGGKCSRAAGATQGTGYRAIQYTGYQRRKKGVGQILRS